MPKFEARFSLETGLFRFHPLEEALQSIKRIGYDAVELSAGSDQPHFDPVAVTEKEARRVKGLLERFDVAAVAMFFGPKHFLGAPDDSSRKAAVKDFVKAIGNARAIGCGLITTEMPPGRSHLALMDPTEVEACRKAWLKSVKHLVPYLDKADVSLAFEPHPGDFVEDNSPAVDLIRDVGSERVGNLYCFPHTFNFTEKVDEMIRYAGKTLMHCHVADTLRADRIVAPAVVRASPELSLRFRREAHAHLIPGRGEVDFMAAIGALKQVNYKGYLSVQAFAHRDDPVGASTQSLSYLRSMT